MDKGLFCEKLRQLVLVFLFGLFGGCIYFNILWRLQGPLFQNEWGMVFDYILTYSMTDIYNWLQSYAVWILTFHMAVCVLGITKIGKILLEGLIVTAGVLVGATETLLVLCFDIKEGMEFLLKVSTVIVVYVLIVGAAFVLACSMSALKRSAWVKSKKWRYVQLKKYLIFVFGTLFLHMVYILICSYVNLAKVS